MTTRLGNRIGCGNPSHPVEGLVMEGIGFRHKKSRPEFIPVNHGERVRAA